MFYQGETIPINISCNDIDLSNYDFVLIVYPHYDHNKVWEFRKNDFAESTVEGVLQYRLELSHQITTVMPTGDYIIEIMILEGGGYRSIYQKTHAFSIKFSNAKNIEL